MTCAHIVAMVPTMTLDVRPRGVRSPARLPVRRVAIANACVRGVVPEAPNAIVSLRGYAGQDVTGRTNDRGEFEVWAPTGTYFLIIGNAVAFEIVTMTAGKTVDARLHLP